MPVQDGLIIEGVAKTYKNGVKALNGVDLTVGSGMYGLLGPNGSGKSSLMRTLATLQSPDSGKIILDGVDVLASPDKMREKLGYLPQHISAYPGVSAHDLLHRFAGLKGITEGSARTKEVERLLDKVNLTDVADRAVSTYSGGMLRRFGIAIALIGSPRLIIVDEPTAGLDPAERNRFHHVLADVSTDAIVLLSTHIVEDIENLCDKLAILAKGQIIVDGAVKDVTAPYEGKMWHALIPRGEKSPAHLHSTARPGGTMVVVQGERPDDRFSPRSPRLEDVYHLALQKAEGSKEQNVA